MPETGNGAPAYERAASAAGVIPMETLATNPASTSSVREPAARVAPPSHLVALDGLRGLACLTVVAYHCFYYGGRTAWPRLTAGGREWTPTHFLTYGYLGVETFFVLSGFCLAYPFLSRPERGYDWKRYFVHRVRRIYPAYWGALLLLSALAFAISHFHIRPFADSNVLTLPSLGKSCLSIVNPETYLNGSFWTLKVELRWYLLLPLLLLLHRRTKSLGLMGVAIAVSLLYSMTLGNKPDSRMSTLLSSLPIFLPLFAGGIWIAEMCATDNPSRIEKFLIRHARWGLLVALGLVAVWTPTVSENVIRYSRVVPGGLLAFFLLLLGLYDPSVRKLLSWRPLVAVGLFSYSLYLIHQPVVMLVYALTKSLGWSAPTQFLFFQVAVFSVCILLGYLFYLFAEKPFLRRTV